MLRNRFPEQCALKDPTVDKEGTDLCSGFQGHDASGRKWWRGFLLSFVVINLDDVHLMTSVFRRTPSVFTASQIVSIHDYPQSPRLDGASHRSGWELRP